MSLLTSFFGWLNGFVNTMLHLAGLANNHRVLRAADDGGAMTVFVRSNQGVHVTLKLDPSWTVGDVKQRLSSLLLKPAQQLKIILAGQALGDQVQVRECDLGPSSTLHVVVVAVEDVEETEENKAITGPLNQSLLDLRLSGPERREIVSAEDRRKHRAHFFIYCSSPCGGLRPGKLRVRCAACGDGAIILEREPCGWGDVLDGGRIHGKCQGGGECSAGDDRPVEFYFKCGGHSSNESCPPLPLLKANDLTLVPCLACTDDKCDTVVVFDCADRHVVCLDCFATYCRSRLNDRSFQLDTDLGYTLGCPVGCPDSLIRETRHFRLTGDTDYERYQRFAAEEFVLQSGGVLCPQPGCGMGILQDTPCRKVTCEQGCGYVFCRDCLQGFHLDECRPFEAASQAPSMSVTTSTLKMGDPSQSRWQGFDPSSLAIRLTTKPCPKCRAPTERDGGCMHMICTKSGCGFHWCWVCQTEWTRDCMAAHWFG